MDLTYQHHQNLLLDRSNSSQSIIWTPFYVSPRIKLSTPAFATAMDYKAEPVSEYVVAYIQKNTGFRTD